MKQTFLEYSITPTGVVDPCDRIFLIDSQIREFSDNIETREDTPASQIQRAGLSLRVLMFCKKKILLAGC
jgi:excinuclease UvrABC helicase subunit UvrB